MKKLLGILGGLGPLASAEFVKTIYEYNYAELEQELPGCILYSDPRFPDRNDAIAGDSGDILVSFLVEILESLCQLSVDKIVISCMTIHYFLPRVPTRLKEKVISLVDLIVNEVLTSKKQHLLLCTKGTRGAGIFQQHTQWSLVENYITFPDKYDQNMIHSLIYEIKKNCSKAPVAHYLETLISKYQVDSLIMGCTELHLVTKYLMTSEHSGHQYATIDPLITIAKNIKNLTNG